MLTSGQILSNKVADFCVTVLNIFSKEVISNRQNQTSKTNFEVYIKHLKVLVNWWWNFTHPRCLHNFFEIWNLFREIPSEIGLGLLSGKYDV